MKIVVKHQLCKVDGTLDDTCVPRVVEYDIRFEDTDFEIKEFAATVETFLKMVMHGRLPMIRTRQM